MKANYYDHCLECGHTFNRSYDQDSPQWRGYCSESCETTYNTSRDCGQDGHQYNVYGACALCGARS